MDIIGVIDLSGGRAVHARAGMRERYAPVHTAAGASIEGDPLALARVYVDRLGVAGLYVADLDAILGRPPQRELAGAIAAQGTPLWLDAGIQSDDDARRALALGARHLVVGLETLPSFAMLAHICDGVGPHVAFSLDLRDGAPVVMDGGDISASESVGSLVARAADAGTGTVIVIDLARVGTGRGVDAGLLGRVRRSAPGMRLVAGGGVRGWEDLVQIAGAGCDAALLATSLQDGRITAADVSRAIAL